MLGFPNYIKTQGEKMKLTFVALLLTLFVSCSTTTSFKVPKDTDLYVYEQKVPKHQLDRYERRPMTWGTAGGVRYRLEKDGKVVETGTLKTKFRVVSIFWPPVALAYWPMGFVKNHTYDFTEEDIYVRPKTKIEDK